MIHEPVILRQGVFDFQVCVPNIWTDQEILTWAEKIYPCGTQAGWSIRNISDAHGNPARNSCENYEDMIHLVIEM